MKIILRRIAHVKVKRLHVGKQQRKVYYCTQEQRILISLVDDVMSVVHIDRNLQSDSDVRLKMAPFSSGPRSEKNSLKIIFFHISQVLSKEAKIIQDVLQILTIYPSNRMYASQEKVPRLH